MDLDFIGFTYNGKHSYRDLKIYRTSNSDRYEMNLTPTMTEKTASVDGQIGQYFFGTKIETLNIPLSFAFDDLSEEGLLELKRVFNGDGIHDLIFDETPYKVYSAKVTGTAVVKHLCFEINGVRHYRGEGSLQFTCYYPYAHSRSDLPDYDDSTPTLTLAKYDDNGVLSTEKSVKYSCGIVVKIKENITVTVPKISGISVVKDVKLNYLTQQGEEGVQPLVCDTSSNANNTIASGFFEKGGPFYFITEIEYVFEDNGSEGSVRLNPNFVIRDSYTYQQVSYNYTDKECFENTNSSISLNRGKILNCYSLKDFPNKWQWGMACGLPLHAFDYVNHGDLPTSFIIKYNVPTQTLLPANSIIKLSTGEIIKILANVGGDSHTHTIVWNSKIGVLVHLIDDNTSGTLLPFSGEGIMNLNKGAPLTLVEVPSGIAYTREMDYIYY